MGNYAQFSDYLPPVTNHHNITLFPLLHTLGFQLEILGPVSEQCPQFREDYKHFATAMDTTRHGLPMKDIYIEEDMGQYLGTAMSS